MNECFFDSELVVGPSVRSISVLLDRPRTATFEKKEMSAHEKGVCSLSLCPLSSFRSFVPSFLRFFLAHSRSLSSHSC